MSSKVRKSRRGQSEVIAAMILIPLLIVIFSTVATNMFKTNVVGTSSLASRARFEQERASENLQVTWSDEACEVINAGPMDITIVRIWVDENHHDYTPNGLTISKGQRRATLPLDNENNIPVNKIDYAVTSRGNVYPLKTMCMQTRTIIYNVNTGGLFTSEDILNMTRLVGTDYSEKKIITRVTDVDNASVLYWSDYPIPEWYFNSGSGWVKDIDSYSSPPRISGTEIDNSAKITDLDGNGINEVTLVKVYETGKMPPYTLKLTPISLSRGGSYNINITFVNLLETRETVDIIAIYFKLVAALRTSPSQQIAIGTAAILQGEDGSAFASGSTAVGSYKAGTGDVFVATGNIFFPVGAYDPYKEVIKPNKVYNLTLLFTVSNPSSNPDLANVRIEYVAVTGAELRWRP